MPCCSQQDHTLPNGGMEEHQNMGHRQLTLDIREIIERLRGKNVSIRKIAEIVGYSPSAVSQELTRNTHQIDGRRVYRAEEAHAHAVVRRQRKKHTCISTEVVAYVKEKLKQYWSPEQIQGRVQVDYPNQPRMRISFKTIYRWIQKSRHGWSPLGRTVRYTCYLRLKRAGKTLGAHGPDTRGHRRDLPSIDDRGDKRALQAEFGHWEGDLVNGYHGKGNALTMVELSTGLLLAVPCEDKQHATVCRSVMEAFKGVRKDLVKTITFDRGTEFSEYKRMEEQLGCRVYFCHPHCPNERALNEHTNGLLRQFYPKRSTARFDNPHELQQVVRLINHRPRKKFRYLTTWEILELRGLSPLFSFS